MGHNYQDVEVGGEPAAQRQRTSRGNFDSGSAEALIAGRVASF